MTNLFILLAPTRVIELISDAVYELRDEIAEARPCPAVAFTHDVPFVRLFKEFTARLVRESMSVNAFAIYRLRVGLTIAGLNDRKVFSADPVMTLFTLATREETVDREEYELRMFV